MSTPKKKTGISTSVVLIGVGIATFLILGLGSMIGNFTPKEDVNNKIDKEKEKELAKKTAVDKWYENSSQYDCENKLKDNLRDPNSYRRDGDFMVLKDDGFEKVIIWKYRATNGFGGFNLSTVVCDITKKDTGTYTVKPITN
jgi:hypothetical protein